MIYLDHFSLLSLQVDETAGVSPFALDNVRNLRGMRFGGVFAPQYLIIGCSHD